MSRIDSAIKEAKQQTGAEKVSLVAHSAGGWMSRVYMLEYGTGSIAQLRSPHNPPPEVSSLPQNEIVGEV